jgi:hypothetical protein
MFSTQDMFMIVVDQFRTFQSNLAIHNVASNALRHSRIEQSLGTDFWNTTSDLARCLYGGSYGQKMGAGA